jgi:ADP-ribosylglycohydrolase
MTIPIDHAARMARARQSLLGLSVGDAFGERFFVDPVLLSGWIEQRRCAAPRPWSWTDDTAMAIALVETLDERGTLDLDAYAQRLANRYWHDPRRGYGYGAHRLFETIAEGTPWRVAATELFGGQGSFGNGAAMRVAPLGAYFAEDDLEEVVEMARRSAIVTHAHVEGQAGAIAVAVAAAVMWRTRERRPADAVAELLSEVLAHTPPGKTRAGLERAVKLRERGEVEQAVAELGNGSGISSQDTVPFCLWCVAQHPRDYAQAMWTTVSGLGDRDTTCAIVGGILAAGGVAVPDDWLAAREPLA